MTTDRTFKEMEYDYLMEQREKRRKLVSTMKVEFLGGTNIGKACEFMYDLHAETNACIIAEFNGVRISMHNAELYKKLYGDRK